MEQPQAFDSGVDREIHGVLKSRVSPPEGFLVFCFGILGVVKQQAGVSAKLRVSVPGQTAFMGKPQFIIRKNDE